MIDGLLLAPDLNRQIAKVVRFDDGHGRYVVNIAGTSEVKRVRPENLFRGTMMAAAKKRSMRTVAKMTTTKTTTQKVLIPSIS